LKGSLGEQRLAEAARTIGALSTEISLPRPASPQSLSPFFPAHCMYRLAMSDAKYHWTQERMPKKILSLGFSMGEDIKIVPALNAPENR